MRPRASAPAPAPVGAAAIFALDALPLAAPCAREAVDAVKAHSVVLAAQASATTTEEAEEVSRAAADLARRSAYAAVITAVPF